MTSARLLQIAAFFGASWCVVLGYCASGVGVAYPAVLATLLVTVLLLGSGAVLAFQSTIASGRRYLFTLAAAIVVATAGVLGIFLGGQSALNPLFRLRFALSEPALSRYAAEASPADVVENRDIGLFHFARIERLPTEVRFIGGMCGVVDQCGLAYRPASPPGPSGKERLAPLGGRWYVLYDVF